MSTAQILDAIRTDARITATVAAVTGAVLVLPDSWLRWLRLDLLRESHGSYFGIAFLASAAWSLISIAAGVRSAGKARRASGDREAARLHSEAKAAEALANATV